MAQRATGCLATAEELLLADLTLAEVGYVLESFCSVPRSEVAQAARSILAFEPFRVVDEAVLQRSVEIYELDGIDFAEACLAANAEASDVGTIVSFERSMDRVHTVERIKS